MIRQFRSLAIISLLIAGCSDSTGPDIPVLDTIQFHGISYPIGQAQVSVVTPGDGPPGFSLSAIIPTSSPGDGFVLFRIQGLGNDPNDLLTVGEKGGSYEANNSIYCDHAGPRLQFSDLSGDEFSIVWESISVTDETFSGEGFINIKQRINYICADSLYNINGSFGPGDPTYDRYFQSSCEPGFFFSQQKIRFSCEEGLVWW